MSGIDLQQLAGFLLVAHEQSFTAALPLPNADQPARAFVAEATSKGSCPGKSRAAAWHQLRRGQARYRVQQQRIDFLARHESGLDMGAQRRIAIRCMQLEAAEDVSFPMLQFRAAARRLQRR
jgi:hypothetical protein